MTAIPGGTLTLRTRLCVLIATGLVSSVQVWAQFDDLDVILTPAARKYCHIIQFPQGWAVLRSDPKTGIRVLFGSNFSDYEFRVEGVLGTALLVSGFTDFFGPRVDTTNRYRVDLSDPTVGVLPARQEVWESGTVVPLTRKSAFPATDLPNDKHLDFHGFRFMRTGEFWAQPSEYANRLSPDQIWLVLQSEARKSEDGSTKIFFDSFDAETGKKLITI
jgi:hypothetical protein